MESMMSRFVSRNLIALVLTVLSAGIVYAQTTDNNTPLTNAAILKLVHAGFKEKTIVSIIEARPPAFDLSPDRMIELKKSGVSERVILAMLNRQQGLSGLDDTWNDDAFFQQKRDKTNESQKPGAQNQTDIFGSSGSGQSASRTRGGGSLSQSGETETTGTATVRIIRPPSETSTAPVKLERTPSLTNDSIIELIEAGFSEGTIMRRIERSPVEFDLSPAKIAELRKHRVGDKILASMKTAMGDESSPSKPGSNGTSKPQ
jgi:hypothetical protein